METNNPNFNTNLQIFSNQNPQIELNANTEQTAQQHEPQIELNHGTSPASALQPEHTYPAAKVSAPNAASASSGADTSHTSGSSNYSDTGSESEPEINYGDMDAIQEVIQSGGSRCGLVYDERMCAHEDPFDKTHPEQACTYQNYHH